MEISKKSAPCRCRNMMYVQQLEHLPDGMTIANLAELVQKLSAEKWAFIIHDKDVGEASHVHLFLQFKNYRSINSIAKLLGDKPQYIQKWDERPQNGFAYLIHATDSSRSDHQYSTDEVIANFDYKAMIDQITKSVAKASKFSFSKKLSDMLDLVAVGALTLEDAKAQLSGSEYSKAKQKLETAHGLYLERNAKAFREKMKSDGTPVRVYWFYGDTGTGKTREALKIAEKLGKFYKTTSVKDPFQNYEGEHVIVLDELRPNTFPYSELLAMFDPYNAGDVTVSSRYYNKHLACGIYIVTTPYSPYTFYQKMYLSTEDHFDQLNRRITEVLRFEYDKIFKTEYDVWSEVYIDLASMDNPYCGIKKRSDKISIFDKMKEDSKSN